MTDYSNKFAVNVDLQGNELKDFKIEIVSSLPTDAAVGRLVFLTSDGGSNGDLYLKYSASGSGTDDGWIKLATAEAGTGQIKTTDV